MEARTNSMQCFVKWILMNTHARSNKAQPCLKGLDAGGFESSQNMKIQAQVAECVSCLVVACVGCCLPLSTGSGAEVAHSGYSHGFATPYCVGVPQSVTRPLWWQHFLHHYTPSVVVLSLDHSSLLNFAPMCCRSASIAVCLLSFAISKAVCPLCTAHKDALEKGFRVAVNL